MYKEIETIAKEIGSKSLYWAAKTRKIERGEGKNESREQNNIKNYSPEALIHREESEKGGGKKSLFIFQVKFTIWITVKDRGKKVWDLKGL